MRPGESVQNQLTHFRNRIKTISPNLKLFHCSKLCKGAFTCLQCPAPTINWMHGSKINRGINVENEKSLECKCIARFQSVPFSLSQRRVGNFGALGSSSSRPIGGSHQMQIFDRRRPRPKINCLAFTLCSGRQMLGFTAESAAAAATKGQ
jgi:hypothetical protein